jgi:transcriptional regulator with XRE-family HTH domain
MDNSLPDTAPAQAQGKQAFDAEIGRRLQLLRLQHGFSQEKLGNKLGVTFQQIQKYEKGSNAISLSKLMKICDIFGVELSFFISSEKRGQSPPRSLTPSAFRAAVVFSRLPPNMQRMILGLMEAVRNRDESR